MSNKMRLTGWVLMLFIMASCSSKKQATPPAPKPVTIQMPSPAATLLKAVAVNENNFSHYYARGSANYRDPDQHVDLNLEITMVKDQYAHVNVTALFGITVAKMWFTRDSICILDIIHRKCIITDYAYLRAMTDVSLKFPQIQAMLAGNSLFQTKEQEMMADTLLNQILITSLVKPGQSQTTHYRMSDYKVSKMNISDKNKGRDLRLEYTECYNQGTNCFPKDFNINIRAEKNMECRVSLDYFAFDNNKEARFAIPKTYKIVRI